MLEFLRFNCHLESYNMLIMELLQARKTMIEENEEEV
jgi:hypothetical protein